MYSDGWKLIKCHIFLDTRYGIWKWKYHLKSTINNEYHFADSTLLQNTILKILYDIRSTSLSVTKEDLMQGLDQFQCIQMSILNYGLKKYAKQHWIEKDRIHAQITLIAVSGKTHDLEFTFLSWFMDFSGIVLPVNDNATLLNSFPHFFRRAEFSRLTIFDLFVGWK